MYVLGSDIVKIIGSSKENIKRATIQMDLSLQGKRFQRAPTHFLSFRLSNSEICEKYREFKSRLIDRV